MRKFVHGRTFAINLVLGVIVIALGFLILYLPDNPTTRMFAELGFENGKEIVIEVASNPVRRAIGLSGKEGIDDNYGMLFIFEEENIPGFWMKGMNFSIDMIWVKGDVIVGVEKNVPLSSSTLSFETYGPDEPIDKVLEVNAGFFDRYGLKIGERLDIRF